MPDGSIDPNVDYVGKFSSDTDGAWAAGQAAQEDALEVQKLLRKELQPFTSDDVDVVVFGSLARREWTSGSDVDWTMLVDGQADLQHRVAAREIEFVLADLNFRGVPLKGPGAVEKKEALK